MGKSRLVTMVALIASAIGIFLVADALAGEKHRLSTVFHMVKFEQMKVAGEEGHVIALWEGKGIDIVTYTEVEVLNRLKTWIINTPPRRIARVVFGISGI